MVFSGGAKMPSRLAIVKTNAALRDLGYRMPGWQRWSGGLPGYAASSLLPFEGWKEDMTTRTTSKIVRFRRPFMMEGFEKPQPAGRYTVDISEEMLDTLSFPVWKRVSTAIRLGNFGDIEHTVIDPEDLEKALAHDATDDATQPPTEKSSAERARGKTVQRKQF